ncbi:decaprenylphospho-beta-D-erythro-pentofuranosid-2-ulose 2-reductase [Sanguibacter gelidistatuariae]|uniref:Decaprenylphospho-beta-D-erythro-pentofuranosid-2-ulose 2-reductase n=1 Tax=Sanguibacter gelidistatuariae TaxID=1814289 RepID=A0A1G6XIZ5_9MICO|nr:decaprenylphospho-beta-D-erythro-pentofuranosid-2-ulose 2-reductase [Sanguibacter gelidistatuariae]SDD78041.1 decaprenylphospho-beta-D-erythro-pentofuranosid-2-ulose 2-reductase [Sanguibacter gelidistatuariae]
MKDSLGNVQRVLVLGGTSDIALATVTALTRDRPGVRITLAARPGDRRTAAVASLVTVGLLVTEVDFEATDRTSYERAIASVFDAGPDVDVVIVAFGLLGDQEHAWQDIDAALELAQVNYTAAVGCGVLVGQRLRAQGHGAIVAMSSVAAELPRRSNFLYGSTKAGMDAFYTGLGDALASDGVQVLVVRPGFVRTKMTAGLDAAPLSQVPEQVADIIVAGLRAGRRTVWAPSALRWVMSGLRHLPGPVFRRLPI